MCSVVGYVGNKSCAPSLIDGLARLEYRGYDSAGVACISANEGRVCTIKSVGGIDALGAKISTRSFDGLLGIGHTRWATHGAASDVNAHPHVDCFERVAVVHNGIIENFRALKERLLFDDHIFVSQTDTEVVAHLVEDVLKKHPADLRAALVDMVGQLEGAFALVMLLQDYADVLVAVRNRSPLCVGIGSSEIFVASDALAFAGRVDRVCYLPDETFAIIQAGSWKLYNFSGEEIVPVVEPLSCDWQAGTKGGHEHFMLKEMYEQKRVVADTVRYVRTISRDYTTHLGVDRNSILELEQVNFLGCGTSWHAGKIAEYFFETIAGIPARSLLASEFRYNTFFSHPRALYIAISQSGETADTLESLRLVHNSHGVTVALTNVISSSIVRESSGFLLTQAGQEVAVASTKAFTAQLAALFWLAHRIAVDRGRLSAIDLQRAEDDLIVAATVLENSIEQYKRDIIERIVPALRDKRNFFFIGRHIAYPFALEAALKLKEIAYCFVDCYPAGELKHGALALVDEIVPVFVFSSLDPIIYQKLLGNAQEARARGAKLYICAFEGQRELIELAHESFILPRVHPLLAPVAMIGLMQFFAYQMAKTLGCSIDKPRNLAKSVTVE